jgi:hypothetical protein
MDVTRWPYAYVYAYIYVCTVASIVPGMVVVNQQQNRDRVIHSNFKKLSSIIWNIR